MGLSLTLLFIAHPSLEAEEVTLQLPAKCAFTSPCLASSSGTRISIFVGMQVVDIRSSSSFHSEKPQDSLVCCCCASGMSFSAKSEIAEPQRYFRRDSAGGRPSTHIHSLRVTQSCGDAFGTKLIL